MDKEILTIEAQMYPVDTFYHHASSRLVDNRLYNRFVEKTPEEIIQQVFGLQTFRSLQAKAVYDVMAGQDLLILMPTGGGKSLCYQVPALCRAGMGLVVSPLIALMDDQVAYLRQRGINAAALHSDLDSTDALQIRSDLFNGRVDLLYISPERLLSSGTLERLKRIPLSMIAIDEAHCIATWGHDFRPEYRGLKALSFHFPNVPRIALTATADEDTRKDIIHALDMPNAKMLASSFYRANLNIAIWQKGVAWHKSDWHKTAEMQQFLTFMKRYPNAAHIVYCASRAKTEKITAFLRENGDMTVLPYHAGLSAQERKAALIRFRSGEPLVVVATIAFGMGIDRADVRSVVHLDMPSSPEAYYQQIGRAGRDGFPSEAVMLCGERDISRIYYWIENAQVSEQQKNVLYRRAEAMVDFVKTKGCRMQALLHCFGEGAPKPCGHCDRGRSPLRFLRRAQSIATASLSYKGNERGKCEKPLYQNNSDEILSEEALKLFNALKQWRKEEAKEQEIPPYQVFHDTVLREIALEKPQTAEELCLIRGVGKVKLARYGTAILTMIQKGI